jgi:hypothetical protein
MRQGSRLVPQVSREASHRIVTPLWLIALFRWSFSGGTNSLRSFLNFRNKGLIPASFVRVHLGWRWGFIFVLDRTYFVRQLLTVLKFAKLTSDPRFAAFLTQKAIDLDSRAKAVPPASDVSPRAPDVEPEK